MEHLTFLKTFKDNLKIEVATDLEKSLEKLFVVVNKETPVRNELLALEGRFNQVKSEYLKSIISYDTRTLALNQIRNGAIEFVQKLELKDLDPAFSPEVKKQVELEAKLGATAETEKLKTAIPPVVKSDEPINQNEVNLKRQEKSPKEAQPILQKAKSTPLSISEYELFVAQHQDTLKAFPRLYRRAREISIRRDINSATEFHHSVQSHLVTLQKFESLLKPIRENIKQIRLDRNNEIYWLQYKMIKEIPETAEEDNLETVVAELPKLESLHESLDKLNLI